MKDLGCVWEVLECQDCCEVVEVLRVIYSDPYSGPWSGRYHHHASGGRRNGRIARRSVPVGPDDYQQHEEVF